MTNAWMKLMLVVSDTEPTQGRLYLAGINTDTMANRLYSGFLCVIQHWEVLSRTAEPFRMVVLG